MYMYEHVYIEDIVTIPKGYPSSDIGDKCKG